MKKYVITITVEEFEKDSEEKSVKTKEITFSEYARLFDDTNKNWTKDPEYNKSYLLHIQDMCNTLLIKRGHLLLNEVYDMLGFDRSLAGQICGWIYDVKNPIGDNFVDFGIQIHEDFINGKTPNVMLDFNHDGCIMGYL